MPSEIMAELEQLRITVDELRLRNGELIAELLTANRSHRETNVAILTELRQLTSNHGEQR